MRRNYLLEYWIDDQWYVGRLKDVPGVFSQGETLEELEGNIKDALSLMLKERVGDIKTNSQVKEISIEL